MLNRIGNDKALLQNKPQIPIFLERFLCGCYYPDLPPAPGNLWKRFLGPAAGEEFKHFADY